MLIIEGADFIGKTTVARRLVELSAARNRHPTYYQHLSCPNEAFDNLFDYQDIISSFAIIDRFHLSRIVYQQAIPYNKLRLIEAWLGFVGSYTVLLTSNMEWYEKWIKKCKTKQMFSLKKNIDAAEKYYLIANLAYDFPVHYDHVIWVDKGWPDDTVLETILDCWYDLMEPL